MDHMKPLSSASLVFRFYCTRCGGKRTVDDQHKLGSVLCDEAYARRVKALPARPFIPSWDMSEGNKRLMLLAAHLERADTRHAYAGEPGYSQREIMHPCGTPACASGHGAVLFGFDAFTDWEWDIFRVDLFERHELFGSYGCGKAKTSAQASMYIHDFTLRRHFAAKLSDAS